MAAVLALVAESLTRLMFRIISTTPSLVFGVPAVVPARTARAAWTASSGSDLPCWWRACRSARLTSSTVCPAPVRARARPAP